MKRAVPKAGLPTVSGDEAVGTSPGRSSLLTPAITVPPEAASSLQSSADIVLVQKLLRAEGQNAHALCVVALTLRPL